MLKISESAEFCDSPCFFRCIGKQSHSASCEMIHFEIELMPWSDLFPNINYQTGHAIFEATHGTAPNIAGKDVVNPCSIILSAVMMLEYFDWKEAAALIEKALEQSFLDARATHDLARFMPNGTSLSTSAFTREIVERIEK